MRYAPLLLVASLACLEGAAAAVSSAPTVQEAGGIVAVEVERASAIGQWGSRTTIAGYSGSAYYHNLAAASSPGLDVLDYPFVVATAGIYQVQLRSRIAEGGSTTEANDSFIRLVNASGNAVAPVPNGNVATSGWYKCYMNVANNWTWNTSNKDHDPQSLAWSLSAGATYRVQLSRRSKGHAVDRVVLWDRARHTLGDDQGKANAAQASALNALAASAVVGGGAPVNQAPSASAGPDRSLTLPAAASLDGTVTDDGLPAGSVLTQAWSQVSGPGTAVFADAAAVDTTATFSAAGTYVLRLTASDGALSASDTMQVVVLEPNDPPLADAGADQAIILPSGASLAGSASDDGRPGPLVVTWSKVSGPGTVTFQDAHALVTTATFSTAGSYLLRLTASDGSLSATDTLTVTVAADPGGDVVPPPVPEAPELVGGSAGQPLLAGSTEAGALVAISDSGTQLATVIADAEGAWSWSPVSALAPGSHSFTVTATDAAGNRSPASAALVHLVPEPAAPAASPAPTAASALPPPGESGGPGCGLGAGALACALVACALAGRRRPNRFRS